MIKILFIILISLLLLGCGPAVVTQESTTTTDPANNENNANLTGGSSKTTKTSANYVGTWMRTGTYTNGELVGTEPATMELTKKSFHSYNKYCDNSGDLTVTGNSIVMYITKSDCPSLLSVGTTTTSTFSVSKNVLTVINNEWGAEVKETYSKIS